MSGCSSGWHSFRSAAVLAVVAAAWTSGPSSRVEAAADREAAPRYACGKAHLTKAQIAREFGLSLETVEKIPVLASLTYVEFCRLPPELRERVVERANTRDRFDHPDEAIRFRRLSLVDEDGEIPEGAEARAFQEAQALRQEQQAGQGPSLGGGITPASWTWLGPGNIGGRLRGGIINPGNPNELLVGSVGGGIWRTINGGASWAPVADFMANLAVTSLAFTPGNWNVQYAATGEGFLNGDAIRGAGVFKSTNGGLSWAQLPATNNAAFHFTNRVAVAGSTVLAATNSGIYRSTNAGVTFTLVRSGRALDVRFNPGDPSRAVAGVGEDGDGGAAHSSNGGLLWTDATGLPFGSRRVEVTYAPSNTAIVYASTADSGGHVYRSTDGGQTYTLRTSANHNYLGDQGWYDNTVWVDPTNADRLIVGGIDLWRSTDGGTTLAKISQWWNWPLSAHADHHLILTHPGFNGTTNRIAYNLNDGGIYRIDDTSTSLDTVGYTVLNNNLGVTQYYDGAASPGGMVAGGTQDNGTLCINAGETPSQWKFEYGGDGGWTEIDPTDANYIYGEHIYANVHRSTTGCAVNAASPILSGQGGANFIAPITLDPNNPNTLLVGAGALLRSTNVKAPSPVFSSIKASIGRPISDVVVAHGNANLILVGHNEGGVYRTTNGTAAAPAWTQVGGTLPSRMVTALAIDRNNTSIHYAAFGGYASDNLYKSINGGATWTNIHGVLPAMPIRAVAIHPQNSNWLYAGTELGVFTTENAGASWNAATDGPANVSVDDLFFVGTSLYAFTHGRGAYRATVVYDLPPTASFTVDCTGRTCTFDASASADDIGIASYAWNFGDGSAPGSGVTATHVYASDATYTVTLTVTDTSGQSAQTTRSAAVIDSPPTASFYVVCIDRTCHADSEGSGDDLGIVNYTWTWGDGQTTTGGSPSSAPSHAYAAYGTYTIGLTVRDVAGQTATDSHVVFLSPGPTAAFTFACTGRSCSFDASGSSSPVAITNYHWDWDDETTSDVTVPTTSHVFLYDGTFTVHLAVTDAAEKTSGVSHAVSVVDSPPTASFYVVCIDRTCHADSEGSGDDLGIVNYTWTWGDGQTTTGGSPASAPSHTYAGYGTYTIGLTVRDAAGQTASDSHAVTLSPAPTAAFTVVCTGRTCNVDASGSSGAITSYHWDWDDESTTDATAPTASHVFAYDGTFGIHLTVTDTAGRTAGVTHAVSVQLPPSGPTAAFTVTCTGRSCNFNASGSSSTVPITDYHWDWDDESTTDAGVPTASHVFPYGATFRVHLAVTDANGDIGRVTNAVSVP